MECEFAVFLLDIFLIQPFNFFLNTQISTKINGWMRKKQAPDFSKENQPISSLLQKHQNLECQTFIFLKIIIIINKLKIQLTQCTLFSFSCKIYMLFSLETCIWVSFSYKIYMLFNLETYIWVLDKILFNIFEPLSHIP